MSSRRRADISDNAETIAAIQAALVALKQRIVADIIDPLEAAFDEASDDLPKAEIDALRKALRASKTKVTKPATGQRAVEAEVPKLERIAQQLKEMGDRAAEERARLTAIVEERERRLALEDEERERRRMEEEEAWRLAEEERQNQLLIEQAQKESEMIELRNTFRDRQVDFDMAVDFVSSRHPESIPELKEYTDRAEGLGRRFTTEQGGDESWLRDAIHILEDLTQKTKAVQPPAPPPPMPLGDASIDIEPLSPTLFDPVPFDIFQEQSPVQFDDGLYTVEDVRMARYVQSVDLMADQGAPQLLESLVNIGDVFALASTLDGPPFAPLSCEDSIAMAAFIPILGYDDYRYFLPVADLSCLGEYDLRTTDTAVDSVRMYKVDANKRSKPPSIHVVTPGSPIAIMSLYDATTGIQVQTSGFIDPDLTENVFIANAIAENKWGAYSQLSKRVLPLWHNQTAAVRAFRTRAPGTNAFRDAWEAEVDHIDPDVMHVCHKRVRLLWRAPHLLSPTVLMNAAMRVLVHNTVIGAKTNPMMLFRDYIIDTPRASAEKLSHKTTVRKRKYAEGIVVGNVLNGWLYAMLDFFGLAAYKDVLVNEMHLTDNDRTALFRELCDRPQGSASRPSAADEQRINNGVPIPAADWGVFGFFGILALGNTYFEMVTPAASPHAAIVPDGHTWLAVWLRVFLYTVLDKDHRATILSSESDAYANNLIFSTATTKDPLKKGVAVSMFQQGVNKSKPVEESNKFEWFYTMRARFNGAVVVGDDSLFSQLCAHAGRTEHLAHDQVKFEALIAYMRQSLDDYVVEEYGVGDDTISDVLAYSVPDLRQNEQRQALERIKEFKGFKDVKSVAGLPVEVIRGRCIVNAPNERKRGPDPDFDQITKDIKTVFSPITDDFGRILSGCEVPHCTCDMFGVDEDSKFNKCVYIGCEHLGDHHKLMCLIDDLAEKIIADGSWNPANHGANPSPGALYDIAANLWHMQRRRVAVDPNHRQRVEEAMPAYDAVDQLNTEYGYDSTHVALDAELGAGGDNIDFWDPALDAMIGLDGSQSLF